MHCPLHTRREHRQQAASQPPQAGARYGAMVPLDAGGRIGKLWFCEGAVHKKYL